MLLQTYLNLSGLRKIAGFTNKEAEKLFLLAIYELQQGSLAVLENFVDAEEVIPSVS